MRFLVTNLFGLQFLLVKFSWNFMTSHQNALPGGSPSQSLAKPLCFVCIINQSRYGRSMRSFALPLEAPNQTFLRKLNIALMFDIFMHFESIPAMNDHNYHYNGSINPIFELGMQQEPLLLHPSGTSKTTTTF